MINLDRLNELLGNDKQIVSRFLDLYIEKVPLLLDRLSFEIIETDFDAVSITAHEIKSQSAYLGLDDVVSIASRIEADAENKKADLLSSYNSKLKGLVYDAIAELRAII